MKRLALIMALVIVIANVAMATTPLGDLHNIIEGDQVGSDYYPSDDVALDQIYAEFDNDTYLIILSPESMALKADIAEGQQQ
jgi:hypothetical protein